MSGDADVKLEVDGLSGYEVAQSHFDVNGSFGGHRTWMVHYESGKISLPPKIGVYTFLGWYWDVGRLDSAHSRLNVAHLATDLMEDGIPPDWLYRCLERAAKVYRRWKRFSRRGDSDEKVSRI